MCVENRQALIHSKISLLLLSSPTLYCHVFSPFSSLHLSLHLYFDSSPSISGRLQLQLEHHYHYTSPQSNMHPYYLQLPPPSLPSFTNLHTFLHFTSDQVYDIDNESASTRNGSEIESPQMASRLPFFQRLFCCGRRTSSSKNYSSSYRSGDDNFGVSGEKEGVRNKLQSYGSVWELTTHLTSIQCIHSFMYIIFSFSSSSSFFFFILIFLVLHLLPIVY